MGSNGNEQPLLELKQISKRFPGVQALAGVDFTLYAGEVHALVGENGAGKSTLIKIIAGVYQPDTGEIHYEGRPLRIQNPQHATELGIAVIHQEPNLYPDLSVLENLFMGRQPTRGPLRLIDWRAMRREAEAVFRTLELDLNLDTFVEDLSVAEQQTVQIAKALSQNARVLIMDEPTSSLSERETEILFRIVRRLRDQGVGIIYISHRLDEVFELADRVTVLRDGQWVGTYPTTEVGPQRLIHLMVGRELTQLFPKEEAPIGQPVLRIRGLTREGHFWDIDLEVRRGEIVGLAGLIGSGRSDLAQSIFGIFPPDAGEIEVAGQHVEIRHPWDALEAGIAYLPEDRQRQGVIPAMSVKANISLAVLEKLTRAGFVSVTDEERLAQEFVDQLNIRTPTIDQLVANLSGGNQQKVIVARWLASNPRVLILDEPTRGIDVGAKAEIHRLMSDLAQQGIGILMISSELPEILGMSDRIIIMREGRIVGELSRAEANQEQILALAAGVTTT